MAAAAGYGDAPTEEELVAYGDLPKQGRDMAEVFAVRVPAIAGGGGERPLPCGSIFFHGGNSCSDLIYSWDGSGTDDEPAVPQPCDSEGNLVLTGPSVATSAYGPLIFDLHLHDGNHGEPSSEQADDDADDNDNTSTGRIFCDTVSGEFSTYDRAITETVTTGYGPVEVIYAVLSNAVEGRVTMKLAALPAGGGDDGDVLGRVVARSKLLDAGCVLFYHDCDGKDVIVRSGELLPLARQAVAVPLHKPLMIELNLHSGSGEEIVRGAVEFVPAITGQQTERVLGVSGAEIGVTVSWSDYPW